MAPRAPRGIDRDIAPLSTQCGKRQRQTPRGDTCPCQSGEFAVDSLCSLCFVHSGPTHLSGRQVGTRRSCHLKADSPCAMHRRRPQLPSRPWQKAPSKQEWRRDHRLRELQHALQRSRRQGQRGRHQGALLQVQPRLFGQAAIWLSVADRDASAGHTCSIASRRTRPVCACVASHTGDGVAARRSVCGTVAVGCDASGGSLWCAFSQVGPIGRSLRRPLSQVGPVGRPLWSACCA